MVKKVTEFTSKAKQFTLINLKIQHKEIKLVKKRIEKNLEILNHSFAIMQYNQVVDEILKSYPRFKLRNTVYICNSYIISILNDYNELIEKITFGYKVDALLKEKIFNYINSLKQVLYLRNNLLNLSSITIEQQLLEIIKNKIIEYEQEIKRLEGDIKESHSCISQDIENFKIKEQIKHIKQKIEHIKTSISKR